MQALRLKRSIVCQDQHQHVAPASSGKNYSPHAVLEEDPLFEGVAEAGQMGPNSKSRAIARL